ncbi:hypothetical protein [Allorhizocola rhizosphaerae]|uniref:hypothetical protein n=1 Tax=Allorhizocola rhizosphaerae TaxID=1872709 RepID=UPI0013C2D9A6|nr:hypothetical protein [Allorhizocola rhizosphaerae]
MNDWSSVTGWPSASCCWSWRGARGGGRGRAGGGRSAAGRAAPVAAGMDMPWFVLPGGHTCSVWGPGPEHGFDRLAAKTRLVR